jgi:ribosomal protein S8
VNREIGNLLKQLIKEGYILNVTTVDGIFVDFDSLFEFSNITVEQKHTKQTILAYTKKNEEIMIAYIDISEQEISIVFSPNINRLKIEIRENNIKIGWIVGTEQRLTGTGGGVYKYTELKKDAKKEELIKKLREGLQWSLSGLIEEP